MRTGSAAQPNTGAGSKASSGGLRPVGSPKLLREQVYSAIEEAIVDGQLLPGQHLAEDVLATELGVSRNPVREALQRLQHEGFADYHRSRGIFVHQPTLTEVQEVFHVRALLEGESASLAAGLITPEQLEAMAEIIAQGNAVLVRQDPRELIILNNDFHEIIFDACGNDLIVKLMTQLRRRIQWYFKNVVVQRSTSSWHQHQEILDVLASGNGDAARDIMQQHVARTSEAVIEFFARHEAGG